MQANRRIHLWTGTSISPLSLKKGIGWGLTGGLAATLVMDLILMGILAAAGLPAFLCFSIVGDTLARFLSPAGTGIAGSIPLGMAAHYAIGPLLGGLFGAAAARVHALRMDTLKKSVLFAVLYAEIFSQPMLALTPVLLGMNASDTLQWYSGSFGMHLIWGCVLGVVVNWGLRLPTAAKPR